VTIAGPKISKIKITRHDLAGFRIAELRRLFLHRYGHTLPDDDAGRDDAFIIANHMAWRPDADRRIPGWLSLWCPWMSTSDVADLTHRVLDKPSWWGPDALAKLLHLKEAERSRHKIRTIGAIDLTREMRLERRAARKRLREELARRAKGAKPRTEYEANSLSRTKPWQAEGISRRTWERRQKAESGKGVRS
jgi:hypothetical protein